MCYTLVAYTCSGKMSTGRAYTSVAYTCGGQMSKELLTRWSHMPAVSKYRRDVYTHRGHTVHLQRANVLGTRLHAGRIHLW